MKNKVCTAQEAVELINDGDVFIPSGFLRSMVPEELIDALEKRFLETGKPRDLTMIHSAVMSEHSPGQDIGVNKLAHDGLITRAFSGFYGQVDRFKEQIKAGKVEAYNFPLGIVPQLLRAYANGKDGELSKIGLKTFIDPRLEGGRWNDVPASGEWIRLVEFLGEEYLYFSTPKPTFALLRGTTADEFGNITFEDEAMFSTAKVAAMAVKQNGGTVVFQVKNIVKGGTLDSQKVEIPGILVDKIVLCNDPINKHRQVVGSYYNPIYSGHLKETNQAIKKVPMGIHKVIGRRSAMELIEDAVVNLGTGNPEFVGAVVSEEGCQEMMTLTVEAGAIGGSPLPKADFGATANAWAYLNEDRMFDLYHGGGLDVAFLGLAEANAVGSVNVSKFKGTIMGCGGFIEITQPTKKIVFLGTFTAGGLKVEIQDGKVVILQEGKHVKFKNEIEQVTFSGEYAIETNQDITYVTERAVFKLTEQGLKLTEIAPGIDLQKDILDKMEFAPVIDDNLKAMDVNIFLDKPMGLKSIIEANS